MIILVTGWFEITRNGQKTGEREFLTSHGYDANTGKIVIVSSEHPTMLGAKYDDEIGEWVL